MSLTLQCVHTFIMYIMYVLLYSILLNCDSPSVFNENCTLLPLSFKISVIISQAINLVTLKKNSSLLQ